MAAPPNMRPECSGSSKQKCKSHGWYTADLRRAVRRCRNEILREHEFDSLVEIADQLFSGRVLEEKVAAVFLLEN